MDGCNKKYTKPVGVYGTGNGGEEEEDKDEQEEGRIIMIDKQTDDNF